VKNEAGLDIDYEWQMPQAEWWLKKNGYAEAPPDEGKRLELS
jgi:hypothetical protein